MKSLFNRLKQTYEEQPDASGEEIIKQSGVGDNTYTRSELVKVQEELREYQQSNRSTKDDVHSGWGWMKKP